MIAEAALTIASNVAEVRRSIAEAARRAGRDPSAVTLVAVTKNRSLDEIRALIAAGVTDIGENRVQELMQKVGLVEAPVSWHFVGHLQRNKVRNVAGRVALIHSVDSVRLAQAVSGAATKAGVAQPVLIQVNVAGEASKYGFMPEEAAGVVDLASGLPGLSVRGLMFMAPIADDPESLRPAFAEARALFDRLAVGRPGFDTLSAGMTQDYEVAIEEGSTMIRVGTALFS